jgi:hypothetical protein
VFYNARQEGKLHKLTSPTTVEHYSDCGCDFVRSVSYAPWITYNMATGVVKCDRCSAFEFLPTPAVRLEGGVVMDHEAIADDLNRFKEKHQNCEEKKSDN